ncbi:hypothetical protein ACTL6U_20240 [Rhodovibrionaceae bacterium A322]
MTEFTRPHQNRVTPFGEILRDKARGRLMGNRGILHDDNGQLQTKRWGHKAWVTCLLSYKDWYRPILQPNRYTELFFHDEAVALAAGHRPCGLCRHQDYLRFQEAFGLAFPEDGPAPSAEAMNRRLHHDRVYPRQRRQRTYSAPLSSLPDGVFFTEPDDKKPLIRKAGQVYSWSFEGYRAHSPGSSVLQGTSEVTVLTPQATVETIRAGYQVNFNPESPVS